MPPEDRLFCLILMWSGARLSEVLALTPNSLDLETGLATFETLKRRRRAVVRQVRLPTSVLTELDQVFAISSRQSDPFLTDRRLWHWSRTTTWRRITASWQWQELREEPLCRRASGMVLVLLPSSSFRLT
jgi:integrase/recombinase XerD